MLRFEWLFSVAHAVLGEGDFFLWRCFRSDLGDSVCVVEFRWVHGCSREVRGRQNSLVTTCFTPWLQQSLRGKSNQSSPRARSFLWTARPVSPPLTEQVVP